MQVRRTDEASSIPSYCNPNSCRTFVSSMTNPNCSAPSIGESPEAERPPRRRQPRSKEQTSRSNWKDQRSRLLVKIKAKLERASGLIIQTSDPFKWLCYQIPCYNCNSIIYFRNNCQLFLKLVFRHSCLLHSLGLAASCSMRDILPNVTWKKIPSLMNQPPCVTLSWLIWSQKFLDTCLPMCLATSLALSSPSSAGSSRRSSKVATSLSAWILATSRAWSERCAENCVRRRATKITSLSTSWPCRINFVELLLTRWWNI